MLPPIWRTLTLFNPVVYLITGFRWSFYSLADISVGISMAAVGGFLMLCLGAIWWVMERRGILKK